MFIVSATAAFTLFARFVTMEWWTALRSENLFDVILRKVYGMSLAFYWVMHWVPFTPSHLVEFRTLP